MKKINLPPPSAELINKIKQSAADESVPFHSNPQNNGLSTAFFFAPEYVNKQVITEYQQFFKHKFVTLIGIMKNNTDTPKSMAPHTDRARTLAINYYVDLGGDHVETIFYSLCKKADGLPNNNVSLVDAGEIKKLIIFDKNWYAFNVDQCHSVKDVITTRIFFAIRFLNESGEEVSHYNLDDLICDYSEIIGEDI